MKEMYAKVEDNKNSPNKNDKNVSFTDTSIWCFLNIKDIKALIRGRLKEIIYPCLHSLTRVILFKVRNMNSNANFKDVVTSTSTSDH